MRFKIVGKIEGVVFEDNSKIKSIRFVPDQEYSLDIDSDKYAILVNLDENSNDAKQIKYKKYIGIYGDTILDICSCLCGKKIELRLKDDGNKVEIKPDADPTSAGSSSPLQLSLESFVILAGK